MEDYAVKVISRDLRIQIKDDTEDAAADIILGCKSLLGRGEKMSHFLAIKIADDKVVKALMNGT